MNLQMEGFSCGKRRKKMGRETKINGSNGGGGFSAKMDYYLYSGDKRHVLAGIAITVVVFGVPWYLMNRGTKHQSHQGYLERADIAGVHKFTDVWYSEFVL